MLRTLADNLEIVWGALLAAAIVVLLTPAVGGMARLLGVVDRPEGRRAPIAFSTRASASWKVFTLSSVEERLCSYLEPGILSMTPSPPMASIKATSSRRCERRCVSFFNVA